MKRKPVAPVRRHFRAYWCPTVNTLRVQVWSFAATDMDDAEKTIRDVVLTVPTVTKVEIESSDGKEKGTVSK